MINFKRKTKVTLEGYVNVTARDSNIILSSRGKGFIEQISPKAFQRAIERQEEILCLLNHNYSRKLGSIKQGNVELYEDNIGLRVICETYDEEVIKKALDNQLRGWSFGFKVSKEHSEVTNNGLKRRFVDELVLDEISVVDNQRTPHYPGTSIEIRMNNRLVQLKPPKFEHDMEGYYNYHENSLERLRNHW